MFVVCLWSEQGMKAKEVFSGKYTVTLHFKRKWGGLCIYF